MSTTRPIIDTAAELDERTSKLTRLFDGHDWSSEFVRHHIRAMIIEAQTATAERASANLSASMARTWNTAEPVPAGATRANGAL